MSVLVERPLTPGTTAAEDAGRQRPSGRRRATPRRTRPWGALFAVVVVGVVHAVTMGGVRFSDDEGTYLSQAGSFLRDGALAPYTYWYDHPPVGWVQIAPLIAAVDLVWQPWSQLLVARAVMVLYAMATAGLLYAVARSLRFSRTGAVATALVWGLSPLAASISSQLYLDNVGMPWLLAAFWLALRRHDMFAHLLAGIVLAVAVLTKETFVLALPGLVWALVRSTHRSNRVFSLSGFAMAFVLTGLAYPLLAATRSELVPGEGHVSVVEGVVWQLSSRAGSGSALDPTSDAHQTVVGWLHVDPVLPVVGLATAVLALLVARLRPIALVTLAMVAVGARPGGYLPLMYVVGLLPFMALTTVGVVEVAFARGSARARRVAAAGAVVAAVALVAPVWQPSWATTLLVDRNADYRRALASVETTVPRDAVVVTDDVFWVDLVAAGRPDDGWSGPVWFPKYQLDRGAAKANGVTSWEDVDYVVSTNVMRSTAEQSTLLRELYSHLVPVSTFGRGAQRVDVFRVDPGSSEDPAVLAAAIDAGTGGDAAGLTVGPDLGGPAVGTSGSDASKSGRPESEPGSDEPGSDR